jgi:hypothetical protein
MRWPRHKIGVGDLLLSRGQSDYSLVIDLGKKIANITFGQLVARCPSLRCELQQSVSIRRTRKQAAEIQIVDTMNKEKTKHDIRSPHIEANRAPGRRMYGRWRNSCEYNGQMV